MFTFAVDILGHTNKIFEYTFKYSYMFKKKRYQNNN